MMIINLDFKSLKVQSASIEKIQKIEKSMYVKNISYKYVFYCSITFVSYVLEKRGKGFDYRNIHEKCEREKNRKHSIK